MTSRDNSELKDPPGTVYVLGAGASHSSDAPDVRMPLQRGFFATLARSGFGPLLAELYHLLGYGRFGLWFQNHGYGTANHPAGRLLSDEEVSIEDLYEEIENDRGLDSNERDTCLEAMDHVVFKSLSMPVMMMRKHANRQCSLHRALAEMLVAGDTVVSFNYDCLIDDALQHFCQLWHPLTGYGFRFEDAVGGMLPNKADIFESQVTLLKPHGSVTLRCRYKAEDTGMEIMLVGMSMGIDPLNLPIAGDWNPLIVPPSRSKAGHRQYLHHVLASAQDAIGRADRLAVVGYSFPRNDVHIAPLFEKFDGELIVVDPAWENDDYKERLTKLGLAISEGHPGIREFIESQSSTSAEE
jgi:hypothetical protein